MSHKAALMKPETSASSGCAAPSDIGLDDVVELLESIARLLELKGESGFKVRAYANAARILAGHPGDIVEMARRGELRQIEGIGDAIASKVAEYVTTGRLPYFEALRDEFPPEIFQLFEIEGLGAKKIKVLYEKLSVHSIPRLERACLEGRVAELDGFGEKSQAKLLKAIENWRSHVGKYRLGDVYPQALSILEFLREHPDVLLAEAAGSLRRRKEVIHDLDFVVASCNPLPVLEAFVSMPGVEEVLAHGGTKASVRVANGLQCDLRVVSMAQYPFALAYFTGSKEHNVAVRSLALKRGWSLNEYELSIADSASSEADAPPEILEEAGIYHALGLDFVEPELREGRGEIEAARDGCLPRLIEVSNLRGSFHNHTRESDGKATLEEMVEAARELGLDYLGIADHSKSSIQANGLDERRLLAQVEKIRELNESMRGEFRIFAGVECDILRDGSLDFSDDVLAQLDYVVASVHSAFTMSEAEMTERILRAIQSPYVTMLGHLTGRLLLTREAYAVNIPAVIEAAAETGTIIELNANPRRLDMDWRWWKTARDKGVQCAINPDAHSVQGLQNLFFGVAAARKGWLRREDVINCLPLGQIEAVLASKKRRAAE